MNINLSRREIILLLIVGVCFITLPYFFTRDWTDISFRDTGNIGDTIGGITAPFLSFFGSILVYLALKAQIDANEQINDQFKDQKIIDNRQNFESTFFNLLSIHHQIIESIDFKPRTFIIKSGSFTSIGEYLSDNDAYREFFDYNDGSLLTSRDVFKVSSELLIKLLKDDLELYKRIATTSYDIPDSKRFLTKFNKIIALEEGEVNFNNIMEISKFQSIYNLIYFELNTDYGHYFRNLYRMIKMVNEKKFVADDIENFKIQYSYTSIIRAQLSDYEIMWLFFNCISDKGREKFKPLLEKYTFLKIIDREDNVVFKFYSQFYKESAFVKD